MAPTNIYVPGVPSIGKSRRRLFIPGASGPSFANTMNISSSAFPTFRAAKARVSGGTGRGRIAIVSDSTGIGWGAGTGGTAYTGARALSWPVQMATGLASRGVKTCVDNWTGEGINIPAGGQTSTTAPAYDPRLSLPAGWAANLSNPYFGGGWINSTTVSPLVFSPAGAIDTIIVPFLKYSGGPAFATSIDAGASLGSTSTTNATTDIGKSATFTVAKGAHAIKITPATTTTTYIAGILAYDSTTPALDVLLGGFGGATSSQFSDSTFAQNAINGLKFYAPDLTIIHLGENDENSAITTATTQANIQTIINAAKLSGDVLLSMHFPCNNAGNIANQSATLAAFQTLAQSNGCGMIDWLTRYGSWSSANSAGLMYDNLHGNATMYSQMGDYFAQILAAV